MPGVRRRAFVPHRRRGHDSTERAGGRAGPQPEAPFVGRPTEVKLRPAGARFLLAADGALATPTCRDRPRRAGTGPGTGPRCVCAHWETGNSGANVSEKQLRSVRCGAGGALNAEPSRVRPPLGLARRWSRAAMRGGIGEGQASQWDFPKVVGNAAMNGGGGVSSPLSAAVPGCRAQWVRGAGPSLAPRCPHSVLSCLAPSTAAAGPGATGNPNPDLASFPLPSKPVTCSVARNHRMPRLERALEIIPWLWAATSSTRPGGSKLPVPWPRTLSGTGQLKLLGSLFHHLSISESALLHPSVHVQSPSILCTALP